MNVPNANEEQLHGWTMTTASMLRGTPCLYPVSVVRAHVDIQRSILTISQKLEQKEINDQNKGDE